MANDFDFGQISTASAIDIETFDELAADIDSLKWITLFSNGFLPENVKKIQAGHYIVWLDHTSVIDLGASIDVLVLACRPRAEDMSGYEPIYAFDPREPEFQRIKSLAKNKRSGCQVGNSFLVYERKTNDFYEFFFGPLKWRPESKLLAGYLPQSKADIALLKLMGKPIHGLKPHGPLTATLTARSVRGNRRDWFAPVVGPCATDIPFPKTAIDEIVRFKNPMPSKQKWTGQHLTDA